MKKILSLLTLMFSIQSIASSIEVPDHKLIDEINLKIDQIKQSPDLNYKIDWEKLDDQLILSEKNPSDLNRILKELNMAIGEARGTVCVT